MLKQMDTALKILGFRKGRAGSSPARGTNYTKNQRIKKPSNPYQIRRSGHSLALLSSILTRHGPLPKHAAKDERHSATDSVLTQARGGFFYGKAFNGH
jgi:hypothetical protein